MNILWNLSTDIADNSWQMSLQLKALLTNVLSLNSHNSLIVLLTGGHMYISVNFILTLPKW